MKKVKIYFGFRRQNNSMFILDLTLKYEQVCFVDIETISFSKKCNKYLTDYNRTFTSEYK